MNFLFKTLLLTMLSTTLYLPLAAEMTLKLGKVTSTEFAITIETFDSESGRNLQETYKSEGLQLWHILDITPEGNYKLCSTHLKYLGEIIEFELSPQGKCVSKEFPQSTLAPSYPHGEIGIGDSWDARFGETTLSLKLVALNEEIALISIKQAANESCEIEGSLEVDRSTGLFNHLILNITEKPLLGDCVFKINYTAKQSNFEFPF